MWAIVAKNSLSKKKICTRKNEGDWNASQTQYITAGNEHMVIWDEGRLRDLCLLDSQQGHGYLHSRTAKNIFEDLNELRWRSVVRTQHCLWNSSLASWDTQQSAQLSHAGSEFWARRLRYKWMVLLLFVFFSFTC